MFVLVTGGGGFLGRSIVQLCLTQGLKVRVFSRNPPHDLQELGAEVQAGDIRDPNAVARSVRGVDAVIHTAAVPGIWGPWKTYYEINTLGTRHVINACRQQGITRLVHTSSPSVVFDGRPHHHTDESLPYPRRFLAHYPHSKALAEQEVLAANGRDGLWTIALRPHLIWGPRDPHLIPRLIQRARVRRLVCVGRGDNEVSISYVDNAAAAHLAALRALAPGAACAGQAYFINDPEPVRLWNWIDRVLGMAGLPPVRRSVPLGIALGVGRLCELTYSLTGIRQEPPMTRFLALQLSQTHTYSIDRARREIGYDPQVTLEEGMRRLEPELRGDDSPVIEPPSASLGTR